MIDWILRSQHEFGVEGITLLGGEPFAHAEAGLALARECRKRNLSTMVFSGYILEELLAWSKPQVTELIALTDILVDGPYERDKPDTERRWIGSTNQRIHFLSERYSLDEQWRKKNTLEIRVIGSEITINGFPATNAVGLWKGWKRKNSTTAKSMTSGDEKKK